VVKSLELLRQFFAAHAHQYVLIGGTAATLALEAVGLPFRATKDLDVVLHVEALDAGFGEAFWRFVETGRYEIRQASATGRPTYYRFQTSGDERYPAMIELFCRAPGGMDLAPGSHLTPVPIDEAVASLSAILLDDDYYDFVLHGRRETDGLPWVGEDRLIPLKAVAWWELTARRADGEPVETRSIRKHAQDVLRLAQLLTPATRVVVAEKIGRDLSRFLETLAGDASLDPHALQLPGTRDEIFTRIRQAYGLSAARAE
jgi:hypothetical protein